MWCYNTKLELFPEIGNPCKLGFTYTYKEKLCENQYMHTVDILSRIWHVNKFLINFDKSLLTCMSSSWPLVLKVENPDSILMKVLPDRLKVNPFHHLSCIKIQYESKLQILSISSRGSSSNTNQFHQIQYISKSHFQKKYLSKQFIKPNILKTF